MGHAITELLMQGHTRNVCLSKKRIRIFCGVGNEQPSCLLKMKKASSSNLLLLYIFPIQKFLLLI